MARRQGKSALLSTMYGAQAQNMAKQSQPQIIIDNADWRNPSHPFAMYSEFKHIGWLAGVHAYQVHNKCMTAMGMYAQQVPTLEGKLWCVTIDRAIHAVRPAPPEMTRYTPEGHAVLWRRSHKLCDVEQAVAALFMLHERVAIIRSFNCGEKL